MTLLAAASIGLVIGFLGGMFGKGGSAIATPLLAAVGLPATIASLRGVIVGSRLASSRDSNSLQRWFVGLLMVVAMYAAIRSGLAIRQG